MFKNERFKSVSISYLVSFFSRASGLLLTLLTTPWLLEYLGKEGYGVWSIFIQFFAFATFSDFGLANGLHNTLLVYRHNQSADANRLLIQKTILLMSYISIGLLLISLFATRLINWESLFDISSSEIKESLYLCFAIVVFLFYINVPLGVIQKVQFAYMDHQVVYAWQAISKLLSVLFIYLGIYWNFNLPSLLVAFFIPLIITNIANILSYRKIRLLTFSREVFSIADPDIKKITHKGIQFFILGLFFALGRTTDQFVIGSLGSLEMAADYQIVSRLFDFPLLAITMLTSIMWSAFADAIQKQEYSWVSKTLFRIALAIIGSMTLTSVVFFLFGNDILSIWLGRDIGINRNFFAIMSAWTSCIAFYNLLASYMNARDRITFQISTFALYFLIGFPAKIIILPMYGLSEFIMLGTLVFLLVLILPALLLIHKDIRELHNIRLQKGESA